MKLPKLPMECIRRMLTYEEISNLEKELLPSGMYGVILVMASSYSISSYTIEELDKLGILSGVITANIYLCNRYELTKEALELFDEIKSNYKALNYFIEGMSKLGQNLLKDQNFTKHILDTFIGPEWKDPDFYLYDDNILNLIIDENSRWKKNIGSILCDGLYIFEDIPKDRINKFYDALRRLKPYIKRRGFRYVIGDSVCISCKSRDLPISIPKPIQQYIYRYLTWNVKNNQLIIEKAFKIDNYHRILPKGIEDFIKRLKEKYPKQMQKADIDTDTWFLLWEHPREYNLPDDLRGLNNI